MPIPVPGPEHRGVQAVAKAVLSEIVASITAESTERSICETAKKMLAERGMPETWYYTCPALVLLGSRSCMSASGRDYVPCDEAVGEFNLVTIDLSPCHGPFWGDCARSIFVEGGIARATPAGEEFLCGHRLILQLHNVMQNLVKPTTTFGELHAFSNDRIAAAGFENLDFLGNVGHSIASSLEDRCFIEPGNQRRLGEVTCFTFEPHIRAQGGRWGFKHENIYYFSNGRIEELA
jgi:Xaa-Pro aminopeptidase